MDTPFNFMPGAAIVIEEAPGVGVATICVTVRSCVVLLALGGLVIVCPKNALELEQRFGLLIDCWTCCTSPLSSTRDAGLRTAIAFCPYLLNMSEPNRQIADKVPTTRRRTDPLLF